MSNKRSPSEFINIQDEEEINFQFEDFGDDYDKQGTSDNDRHNLNYNNEVEDQQKLLGDESEAGDKKTSHSFWTFEYYQQFFDVESRQVGDRILWSAIPKPDVDFLQSYIRPNPDLYGPFWICITLILSTAVAGNLSNYLQSSVHTTHWRYDFHKVTIASSLIFLYAWIIPLVLKAFLLWRGSRSSITLLELLCLYGYSLAIFVPVSLLWMIPVRWLQWCLGIVASVLSGAVLVRTIKPAFSGYSQKISVSVSAVLLLLHTVLALGFMLYFFYPPNPSNITVTVSVTPLPNVLKNGTLLEKTRILNEKEKKIDGMQSLSLKKYVHDTEINKTEISKRNKIKDDNIKAEDENSKTDVKNNEMSKTNVDNENGLSKGDAIKDEKRIIRSDTDIKDKTGKSKIGEIKNENEISKLGGKDENGSINESAIENKNRITEKNETKDENEMSKKSEIKNENRINGTDSTLKINTEKINNRSGK